jgi:hypothetical protein
VPPGCIQELVAHDIEIATTMSKFSKESAKVEMAKRLDITATLTIGWIREIETPLAFDGPMSQTLLKYGIQRGTLKQHA